MFLSVDQNISRFANSQLHQNCRKRARGSRARDRERRHGVATTTAFDEEEIARTADVAREAARHSSAVQGFRGLYRDNEPVSPVDSFDEATATISANEKATALRVMFDKGRDVLFAGSYATAATSVACGNTHGVRRYARMTHADATVIALPSTAPAPAMPRDASAARPKSTWRRSATKRS